ncbi:phage tail protein [Mesorhizobium sp. YIM 152430]|uniref:phage tail protein n=1 Tax=Mesorhizobium sp. YIM 152430 TaxID=3031761 RepID=UPI0023DBC545|nr:phage tail protein [Mesorhizobium sp. YIM 152430]MDF1599636.1 phage tail protein [Mesorhizobium sp. YIM 152430]
MSGVQKASISVRPADDVLKRYGNMLGSVSGREGHRAMARAINRTVVGAHVQVSRAVAKQSSIPLAEVRRSMKRKMVNPGSRGALQGALEASSPAKPIRDFMPKQFAWGVRVKAWGKMQRYPGAFIFAGTFKSGKPVAKFHALVNRRTAINPLEIMYGPSVPQEMVRRPSSDVFETTAYRILPQRLHHELGRLFRLK